MQEHREIAREAVRKSLVLLKNGKTQGEPLLPLPKKAKKILALLAHMRTTWAISVVGGPSNGKALAGTTSQKVSSPTLVVLTFTKEMDSNLSFGSGTTLLEAVKQTVDPSTEVVYSENPDENFFCSNEFSYAIVAVGEQPYAETMGDSRNLTIPEPGPSIINGVQPCEVCGGSDIRQAGRYRAVR
ncbi:hypothetical protein HPP92_016022 [Vanilla planifolia]|uniref:beta-glucosidase n=1 Tax=Vanilla planifolia TaxID=51239 RepID=A0A835UTT4_VANPL|nr:hypothetical protein HPP92_016022 [Vanilla planifolia]